ncbi:hypothetical protein SS1G_12220 [Sclerotinia sclerotiorum 1980 UF-70]|uniref:Uncharacterized protein n=1 Tax=Sclerotinia sclerotiorum (strain ATCC 18683 / 1980 / Ss-1) TaxID=665079 RepID=A7F2S2_SCLS1|nr:hypothetical protein SS1G_12220 [Sclerotinia sclerotiorum 1980 UF-70]EDN96014.1 hypothetical protein SS1G_12220 [Sclerotinia sclerotiorum 1980 UF-70]
MTRGVAGISENDLGIVKFGKQGIRITPVNVRRAKANVRSSDIVENRCWSFREERFVLAEEDMSNGSMVGEGTRGAD